MSNEPVVQIQVVGPFRLIRSGGEDCTPANRKTRALLALLALSPGRQRTRAWLQERLWGTRGREQGAASIRQCLADIRKVLGPDRECLLTTRTNISLHIRLITCDFDHIDWNAAHRIQQVELLEGLDIPYESFTDWLRHQRHLFRERLEAFSARQVLPQSTFSSSKSGNVLVLSRSGAMLDASTVVQADDLLDHVGRTISELGIARVIDHRRSVAFETPDDGQDAELPGLNLRAHFVGTGHNSGFRISLIARVENEFIWSGPCQSTLGVQVGDADLRIVRQSNDIAGMTIERLMQEQTGDHAPSRAAALSYEGVRTLFKLGEMNFRRADDLFAAAYDLHPRGLFLAWRAYLRTFLLVEQRGSCRHALDEEAFEFLRKAIEIEPNNSYVCALGAHVHSILRRSYATAYEMAERSVELNPANPIGWACLGIAQCYLGKSNDGLQNTLRARSIAGFAPARYQIDALGCIAATMAGCFDTAIHLGESSHILAPDFAAPMRYLSALYILRGEEKQAFAMVEKLRRKEPDFSYRKLNDRSYPAAGLHKANILSLLPAE
jgi:tetratricopeptide (TPR) repeat protein